MSLDDARTAYHGPRVHVEVFQELLLKLAEQEASVTCQESLPEHFVGDHTSRQLTSRSSHTVITIPPNCNVDSNPINFPKAVVKFLGKKADANLDHDPIPQLVSERIKETRVLVDHLERALTKVQDIDQLPAELIGRIGTVCQEKLQVIGRHPADRYIHNLEKRYRVCLRLCTKIEDALGISDTEKLPSFALAPSAVAMSTLALRYFDTNVVEETQKILRTTCETREKAMNAQTAEYAASTTISTFETRLIQEIEKEHNMIIDQIYAELTDVLPQAAEIATIDGETATSLSGIREDMTQLTSSVQYLQAQLKSGVASLSALTSRVDHQVTDLKQILASL